MNLDGIVQVQQENLLKVDSHNYELPNSNSNKRTKMINLLRKSSYNEGTLNNDLYKLIRASNGALSKLFPSLGRASSFVHKNNNTFLSNSSERLLPANSMHQTSLYIQKVSLFFSNTYLRQKN